MLLRNLFIAGFLLLLLLPLRAQKQRQLIPYRQGKLWGMADTTGKIIVAPKYDYVEFNSIKKKTKYTLPEGYYYVVKDSLIGIISNKEIIPPVHGIIECFDGILLGAAPNKNSNPVFYNMDGKLVIKDPCTIEQAIWSYENPNTGKPEVVFIKCTQPDKLKAIFCYYLNEPSKSGWLYKDCISIRYSVSKSDQTILFELKRKEEPQTEYIQTLTYDLAQKVFMEKYLSTNPKEGSGYGRSESGDVGSGSGYSGEREYISTIGSEQQEPSENTSAIQTINKSFEIKNDTLFCRYSYGDYRSGRAPQFVRNPIQLPEGSTKPEVLKYFSYVTLTEGNTRLSRSNAVLFNYKGKKGLLTDEKFEPVYYDSILLFSAAQRGLHHFLVGDKTSDGSWRLGTIDEKGQTHLPQNFEQIINFENTPANASLTAPFMYLLAKKDNQWGIVNANNELQLPFAYDSIYLARKSGATDCMVLKKNGKYGLYFDREHNTDKRYPRQLFEPQFDYQPRAVYHLKREKSTANYFLMLLVDEKGTPMGYVDEHGRKFWKD
ncbi:MAG: hypothetical protein RLZZ543_640 [Bacteroidota bacterium]|jgi:hypothetical protein